MNIYVSNLNFRVQDEKLREIFEEFGEVSSAKVIKDHVSGKSRGFGFVEMPDEDDALTAIDELNGAEVDGKELQVSKAKPRKTENTRNGGGNRGGFNRY